MGCGGGPGRTGRRSDGCRGEDRKVEYGAVGRTTTLGGGGRQVEVSERTRTRGILGFWTLGVPKPGDDVWTGPTRPPVPGRSRTFVCVCLCGRVPVHSCVELRVGVIGKEGLVGGR